VALAEIAGNSAVSRVLNDTCEKLVLKRRIEGVFARRLEVLRTATGKYFMRSSARTRSERRRSCDLTCKRSRIFYSSRSKCALARCARVSRHIDNGVKHVVSA